MPLDLWSFAKHVYAQPGVEAQGLELQAKGADVCLVLAALWLERDQVSCTAERLQQLQQLAQTWQGEVITPLRKIRQAWKPAAQTDSELNQLRQQLLALELQAERTLLQRIERLSKDWTPTGSESSWLNSLGLGLNQQSRAALDTLRSAAELP